MTALPSFPCAPVETQVIPIPDKIASIFPESRLPEQAPKP
jgi:hypothetical protein